MRRTRSPWEYALFAIPAVFVIAGILYLSKHHDLGVRSLASVKESPEDVSQLRQARQKVARKIAQLQEDEDTPDQDLKASVPVAPVTKARGPASGPVSEAACTSVEYPGRSPESAKPTAVEWAAVMKEFHGAKFQVSHWLSEHKSQFSEKTFQWMQSRVSDAELMSPPQDQAPDLSWRGIGVLGELNTKVPLISVGAGVIKWVAEKPQRARFEFARLLAQTWAPCEIAKVDATAPWKDLVACLDLSAEADPAKVCGPGSFSEAGWAVSSAIAAVASPPGCRIPAFEKATVADCMKKSGVQL